MAAAARVIAFVESPRGSDNVVARACASKKSAPNPCAKLGRTDPEPCRGLLSGFVALSGASVLASACQRLNPTGRRSRRVQLQAAAKGQQHDNLALVFVKPHACTPAVLRLVPEFLSQHGVVIAGENSIEASVIDKEGIIDSHYDTIARVGMATDIGMLHLGAAEAERFLAGYGRTLSETIAAGEVYTAVTAMEALRVSPTELLNRCLAAGYEKLRSGLYCAKLETPDGNAAYVLNGFYARMRDKFVALGVVVHCFLVRFNASELQWSGFRNNIIGATQPKDAIAGSLRARIRDEWQELDLKEETNYQDNGVHASAGPLEALRERMIWLGQDANTDPFGEALRAQGVDVVDALVDNPLVECDGVQKAAFDLTEDVDTVRALDMLARCTIVG
eukprot:CAMPEP_0172671430 /NCGR_PEP_ID=MMETSP1074-20121228/10912_1 /TAXON_ID=2916 /ORGANISM="Ceratium fusus, Strain PA161109" /LENGTH=390 /DNA_ID=CAMNT_0013488473 /DNA_START=54 /DNA_END=1226 /DNA_ORIENTATION=+